MSYVQKSAVFQAMEQKNFRPHRRRPLHQRFPSIMHMYSPTSLEFSTEEGLLPEHDLEPPKFCRRALETVLSNWPAVESMLLGEHKSGAAGEVGATASGGSGGPRNLEDLHMHYQSGAIHLDQFVFGLLSGRCTPDMLDTLVSALIREMQNEAAGAERQARARLAAARLVRAVIRLYLLLSLQVTPNLARPKK